MRVTQWIRQGYLKSIRKANSVIIQSIQKRIYDLRGERIMLDSPLRNRNEIVKSCCKKKHKTIPKRFYVSIRFKVSNCYSLFAEIGTIVSGCIRPKPKTPARGSLF